MKLDVDNRERLKVAILFLLQSYKVAMGSLLLVFVPRSCADNKLCTFRDNLDNRDYMNFPALCFNFITVFAFLITYIVELKRENWFVSNFDIDHNKADNNLAIVLKNKPDLLNALHSHNNKYYRITQMRFFIYLVNFIFSCVFCFLFELYYIILN